MIDKLIDMMERAKKIESERYGLGREIETNFEGYTVCVHLNYAPVALFSIWKEPNGNKHSIDIEIDGNEITVKDHGEYRDQAGEIIEKLREVLKIPLATETKKE